MIRVIWTQKHFFAYTFEKKIFFIKTILDEKMNAIKSLFFIFEMKNQFYEKIKTK